MAMAMPQLGRSSSEWKPSSLSRMQKLITTLALFIILFKLLPHLLSSSHPQSSSPLPHNLAAAATDLSSRTPKSYYLGAVIFNRVFTHDLFAISAYECKQWIEYMLYSGIQHIFWYDTAHSPQESQESSLQPYVNAHLLTYHRFHHLFPGKVQEGYHFEQDNSYAHFLQNYGHSLTWAVEMDVDEYPFSPSDTDRSFLQRLMHQYDVQKPNVTQVLLQCMIFGGNPKGDLQNGWVIERYQRRKHETEGALLGSLGRTKPIFKPHDCTGVTPFDPHIFRMKEGRTEIVEAKAIRMNHYWGARLSDFGPDTEEVERMLELDTSIQVIATRLKHETGLVNRSMANIASSIS